MPEETVPGALAPPFEPFPFLSHPHLQTIAAAELSFSLAPPSKLETVALPDGDRLAIEVSTPQAWSAGSGAGRAADPTVVLIHGLCGSSRSPYILRIARKLYLRGIRAVRVNLRGCGPGRDLAREPYHSGRSDDARAVLEHLRRAGPRSLTTLAGFSLGGNIALKLAGEMGEAARGLMDQVIAVCPPADLLASCLRLTQRTNRLYDRFFVWLLQRDLARRQRAFPDERRFRLPPRLTLMEFDDLYTAPRCGFRSGLDYYRRSSALPLLGGIAVPCRILYSADDPIVDNRALERAALAPTVKCFRTSAGGHLGFLARPGAAGGVRWMDELVLEWCS